jgi:hypothetical protein
MIQARANILGSVIYKLIQCTSMKEELPQQWKEFIILPIYKKEW